MFGADGKITEHIKLEYHQVAMIRAEEFKIRLSQPSLAVDCLLNSARQQEVKIN